MGIEDVRVRHHTNKSLGSSVNTMLALGFVETFRDTEPASLVQLQFEDSSHIVEAEANVRGHGCVVCVRFALCNPPSVDTLFFRINSRLFDALESDIVVEDSSSDEGPHNQGRDMLQLEEMMRRAIVTRRLEWQNAFGVTTAKLTCRDAIVRYIMKGS